MAYDALGKGSLDYLPCRYGASRIRFRGPKRKLDQPYVAVLGGSETYGRFLETPYPQRLESALGKTVVNLGNMNAGIDVFLRDETVMHICEEAEVTVIQMPSAHNMSNRFYSVHPRRNDRFIKASDILRAIYSEVDFTEHHFTQHMLKALADASSDRFQMVKQELREAWTARMKTLIGRVGGKVVLMWLADHSITRGGMGGLQGTEPLFVERQMMEEIMPLADETIEIVVSPEDQAAGRADMVVSQLDSAAAASMLGSVAHDYAAEKLLDAISALS